MNKKINLLSKIEINNVFFFCILRCDPLYFNLFFYYNFKFYLIELDHKKRLNNKIMTKKSCRAGSLFI